MSVVRRVHSGNFTIISNALLCDRSLKADAVGVICYLVSKPDNWTLRPGELADRFDCGSDRIQRIMKELIEAGYIRKVRQRDPKTQSWQAVEYIVLDTKDEPLPENTHVAPPHCEEKPPVENPSLAFPVLQRTEDNKTDSKKETRKVRKAKAGEYTDEFLQSIWEPYPRKINTSKINAFKKWSALVDADQAMLRAAIPAFALSKRGTEEQFIPHLEFFISRRIFETVGARAPEDASPACDRIDRKSWENLSKIYESSNNWHRDWGPEPGHPRCRMPIDLQQQFVSQH